MCINDATVYVFAVVESPVCIFIEKPAVTSRGTY